MSGNTQGYLVVALGNQKYLLMAIHCALSLRRFDERPIQLVLDNNLDLPEHCEFLFDRIDRILPGPEQIGPLCKLSVYDFSEFQETLFVDADCLLLKNDMNDFWNRLQDYDFSIPGGKKTEGTWNETVISDCIRTLKIPYLVQMNTGVIYFKKNSNANDVFNTAKQLVNTSPDILGQKHAGGMNDEPFFGAAMGYHRIEPFPLWTEDMRSLMFSTIKSRDHKFDIAAGIAQFWKGRLVTPSITHFVGLQPREPYRELCYQLRNADGIPRSLIEALVGWPS